MINKLFNNKELDLLSDAEEYFIQVRNNFKRNSPHALDEKVYEILNSVEPTHKPKYSCSRCIFNLYKRASEIYFISKEKIENDGKEKNIKKNSTTTPSTAPKRRGRRPNPKN